jgi:hypothetical protein
MVSRPALSLHVFARDRLLRWLRRAGFEGPGSWAAPWTLELPLVRDDSYGMYECACHEGNCAMFNILSGARAEERAAAAQPR